jgi:phosphotransferase system HPr (HPr) family protein
MKFVDVAQQFQADITVSSTKDTQKTVDGKSAMELMLLGATDGTTLRIVAIGSDAQNAVDDLVELVRTEFGLNT